MPLIKSHSNYQLKSKHQSIKDGTVFERDITTIGAINQFAPGQTPIYRTGNFIITVRDDMGHGNQYNSQNWEKGTDGETWTQETVNKMVSGYEREDDTKIVLKNDYYDFRDFAYYGSLTEMFQASILDILNRFPGELFFSDSNKIGNEAYYTRYRTEDGRRYKESVRLGGDGLFLVSNPFGINIHTKKVPLDYKPRLYFANEGWKNYNIIIDDVSYPITGWDTENSDPCPDGSCDCIIIGDGCNCDSLVIGGGKQFSSRLISIITITYEGGEIKVYAYLGDNGRIVYLHDSSTDNFHIRPNNSFIKTFYNECDDFQTLLVNDKTTPKYKATFSVLRENDYGYYKTFEDFIFPTADGGNYNLGSDSSYVDRLLEIGEFYDEKFTDNLYRAMTHESIKNFDWSANTEEDEEGGQKIQKALRIFAREFDEIKKYIDKIKNVGTITYDERNNLPDYFLVDTCEDDGWDIKSVMPYNLSGITDYSDTEALLENSVGKHEYSQSSKTTVKPYTANNVPESIRNGYFIDCLTGKGCDCITIEGKGGCDCITIEGKDGCDCITIGGKGGGGNEEGCLISWYGDMLSPANGKTYTTAFSSGRLEHRIKPYTDEREYTYMELQNEFLRRLKLNSRALWRHKGTLEGIEMILGMFGLKSQRWLDRSEGCKYKGYKGNTCDSKCDYEIQEFTQFTTPIEDKWNEVYQMYEIDWLNSTKTITYDYRSTSNYTRPGRIESMYSAYQGLPVAVDVRGVDENGHPLRYLYPNFNKNEQIDGNPYYQMDGGWLSKTIADGSGKRFQNFQFDVNDDIVHTRFLEGDELGVTEDGFINDNHRLYKETIRSIKRVENLSELLSQPQMQLSDGIICYVGNVASDIAVIEGQVFDVTSVVVNDDIKRYVPLTLSGGFITVGNLYFDSSITVYNSNGEEFTYDLRDKLDGFTVDAYFNGSAFVCKSGESNAYMVRHYQLLSGNTSVGYSNYYMLDDVVLSNMIATDDAGLGWRRLKYTDSDYLKINTIANYYGGNNGHNGNLRYDSGHEYFTYFQRLFKYAEDNGLFDTRCYSEGYDEIYDKVHDRGFSGLINPNEEIKEYDEFLSVDTKVHYFGNYKKGHWQIVKKVDNTETVLVDNIENTNKAHTILHNEILNNPTEYSGSTVKYKEDSINIYGEESQYQYNCDEEPCGKPNPNGSKNCNSWKCFYGTGKTINYYQISDDTSVKISGEIQPHKSNDPITNQIVNNKRFKIIFNMKNEFNSKEGQIELKYIDEIIMNYLTQMLPSTVITEVEYRFCGFNCNAC